jgi:hypothetical protein
MLSKKPATSALSPSSSQASVSSYTPATPSSLLGKRPPSTDENNTGSITDVTSTHTSSPTNESSLPKATSTLASKKLKSSPLHANLKIGNTGAAAPTASPGGNGLEDMTEGVVYSVMYRKRQFKVHKVKGMLIKFSFTCVIADQTLIIPDLSQDLG